MDCGYWNQYRNQTMCGNNSANWLTNRKSLYHQQAPFPQYKIFLNEPDSLLFPPDTTLGQLIAPFQYGVQNCVTGHIVFHVEVNKPGNVEITLTFPVPYQAYTLNQAVVAGTSNVFDWDGLDNSAPTRLTVPNNTPIQFTVKYINGLKNLPLYDVEGNNNGFTVALVSPVGTTPAVFWDDTNIPGGTNNSSLPGYTSPRIPIVQFTEGFTNGMKLCDMTIRRQARASVLPNDISYLNPNPILSGCLTK